MRNLLVFQKTVREHRREQGIADPLRLK